ncbi:MAG TPA: hypothetical protein VFA46_20785 [Actinomycetes bacterium]|jgi:hypothetical protein|nr:hypothetical protein [Actinomycetes bacterium]
MGEVVLAAGVPHAPYFPRLIEREGPEHPVARLFRRVAHEFELASPDLLVVFDSDHFVNFFFDNLPTFAVGVVEMATGPAETNRSMPSYRVAVDRASASSLADYAVDMGFDVASCEALRLDHSVLVPLHFLTPRMDLPILPVFVRGMAEPLPRAGRCLGLGQMVGRFLQAELPRSLRVAVLASGSISLEIGGPRMGMVDRAWVDDVAGWLAAGDVEALVGAATPARMAAAGNAGGELLNWLALLGSLGSLPLRPAFVETDFQPEGAPREGDAYAVWRPGDR